MEDDLEYTPYGHLNEQELTILWDKRSLLGFQSLDQTPHTRESLALYLGIQDDRLRQKLDPYYVPLTTPEAVDDYYQRLTQRFTLQVQIQQYPSPEEQNQGPYHIQSQTPNIPQPGPSDLELPAGSTSTPQGYLPQAIEQLETPAEAPQGHLRTPHPPDNALQQEYQLPNPWQYYWDYLPAHLRTAKCWESILRALNQEPPMTAEVFMDNLARFGLSTDQDNDPPSPIPRPSGVNPSSTPWPDSFLQFTQQLSTIFDTTKAEAYFYRIASFWQQKYNVEVTPELFLSGFRDAMRNRLLYDYNLQLYGPNDNVPYQPNGHDLLGIDFPPAWGNFLVDTYLGPQGPEIFARLLSNLHLSPNDFISINGIVLPPEPAPTHSVRPAQDPNLQLCSQIETNTNTPIPGVNLDSLYRTVFNLEAEAAQNSDYTGPPCYQTYNAQNKPRFALHLKIIEDKMFAWWGNFVDESPQKPDESNRNYRARLFYARDNMRIQMRARPELPPPVKLPSDNKSKYNQDRQNLIAKYNRVAARREGVHLAKMDPSHKGYDAEYRRTFRERAIQVHAENMRRRVEAVAYRNSEAKRVAEAAHKSWEEAEVYHPPVNLEDYYEDDHMLHEGGDNVIEEPEQSESEENQENKKKRNSKSLSRAKRERCKRCANMRRRCDLELRQPCTQCINAGSLAESRCKKWGGKPKVFKQYPGPYLVSHWVRNLAEPPTERSSVRTEIDWIRTHIGNLKHIWGEPFKDPPATRQLGQLNKDLTTILMKPATVDGNGPRYQRIHRRCTNCARKKLRCQGTARPCGACVAAGEADTCADPPVQNQHYTKTPPVAAVTPIASAPQLPAAPAPAPAPTTAPTTTPAAATAATAPTKSNAGTSAKGGKKVKIVLKVKKPQNVQGVQGTTRALETIPEEPPEEPPVDAPAEYNRFPCMQCRRLARSCDTGPRPCKKCVAMGTEDICEVNFNLPAGLLADQAIQYDPTLDPYLGPSFNTETWGDEFDRAFDSNPFEDATPSFDRIESQNPWASPPAAPNPFAPSSSTPNLFAPNPFAQSSSAPAPNPFAPNPFAPPSTAPNPFAPTPTPTPILNLDYDASDPSIYGNPSWPTDPWSIPTPFDPDTPTQFDPLAPLDPDYPTPVDSDIQTPADAGDTAAELDAILGIQDGIEWLQSPEAEEWDAWLARENGKDGWN